MANPAKVTGLFRQADHTEALLDLLMTQVIPNRPEFADWAMVVIFYAAVQRTHATLLRDHNEDPRGHRDHHDPKTGQLIRGQGSLVRDFLGANVSQAYQQLYQVSREARYRPFGNKFTKTKDALNALNLLVAQLRIVQNACHP
jgi:hypothetical protein